MNELLSLLESRGRRALPGIDAHRRFAPEMAYGRHRGPIAASAHRAAVVIALMETEQGLVFPLILRSDVSGDQHRGQISLPGGRLDGNELAWHGAKREFSEELGASSESLRLVTQLTPLYVYASNHWVQPFVAHWEHPGPFKPNPAEVAELLWIPVSQLIDQTNIHLAKMLRGNCVYNASGYRFGESFVWGATAMILGELAAIWGDSAQA